MKTFVRALSCCSTFLWCLYPLVSEAQINYNQTFALEVKGRGYLEYREREYGINLVWSSTPAYQWEFRKTNASGQVQANTPIALFNTFTNDYVVYASREYGINLKWLRDTDQNDQHDWYLEGNLNVSKPCFLLNNRTLAQSGNSKPYVLYGERDYGINLVWGSKPAACNWTVSPVKTRYDRRTSIPTAGTKEKALFDKAAWQMDVIGSEYAGTKFKYIGLAPAERENFIESHIDMWFPIDGNKQTVCGRLNEFFPFDGSIWGDDDDDLNLNIVPYSNTPSQQLLSDMQRIGWQKSGTNDPYPHVQAEIDVINASYKPYFYPGKPYAPQKNEDDICAYGPWVTDKDHQHKPEIHPAEQIWWREGNNLYYLSYMCDNSGRFDGLTDGSGFTGGRKDTGDDYDTDNGSISFSGPWAPRPIEGAFAMAFKVRQGKEKVFFNINKIAGQHYQPVNTQAENIHFLIVKSDTLALVVESDALDMNVTFENVCQVAFGSANYVQGFIVLRAKTGQPNTAVSPSPRNDDGGQLLLKVTKNVWQQGTSAFTSAFDPWKKRG